MQGTARTEKVLFTRFIGGQQTQSPVIFTSMPAIQK